MKTKTVRLAFIDAINLGNDELLMTALRIALDPENYMPITDQIKRRGPIRALRREMAKAIRIQRRNERERRIEKEEEERERLELVRKEKEMYASWGMPR